MTEATYPYPPLELAHRVGSLAKASDPLAYYDKLGRDTRQAIVTRLPEDWSFAGKRVLDFGCGAGRTLRHFAAEADEAELWGCDIDEASIDWMEEELCPPFHVFTNGAEPPLEQPDASFDLIWAISVFTHLADNWSRWLVELHRVLKPDGLLLVTFMGRGMSQEIAGEQWDDEHFGMNVIKYGQSWDLGGPMVLHSPWWIEAHWGRAFEVLSLAPDGFAAKPWLDHGCLLMRKRDLEIDPEELERISPTDTRETNALLHNVSQLHLESRDLRDGLQYVQAKLDASNEKARSFKAKIDTQTEELSALSSEVAELQGQASALRSQASELNRKATVAQQQAASAKERSINSAQRLLDVEEVLAQSRARTFAVEQALEELQPKLESADLVMSAMKASISWRITAPLRALKRRR